MICSAGYFRSGLSVCRLHSVLDLVTEQDVNDAIRANRVEVLCTPRAIVTPAAWDRSAATGLTIRRV